MSEQKHMDRERRLVADILRRRKDELVSRWMEKIQLLTGEKGEEGIATEQVLRDDAHELIDMVLSRLEGREPDSDMPAFYHLIFEGREHNVRLADVAYVLLELKSVSKQIVFENVEDELEAFRVSRLMDDTVEAVLRKSADLHELSAEADQQTAQERLQEIFAAWDVEESLTAAQSPLEVCSVVGQKLQALWDLSGFRLRYGDSPDGEMRDIAPGSVPPMPVLREQHQYLTERELASGSALSLAERVRRRREPYICGDVRADALIVNVPELTEAGVVSIACTPLLAQDAVIGVLFLYSDKANTFCDADLRRLGDFANGVARALDRTGRLERSRKEIGEAEVIARIGRSLLELPTHEALLQGVVEALRAFRDYFDVSLFRVDQQAGECVLTAEAGRGRRYRPEQYRQRMGEGFIGLCAQTGETIRASDLDADSRRLIAFEEEYRAQTELAVPVKKGGEVLGVMHFLSERPDDFPESEIAALEHVAPHIGVALQNASMISQRRHDQYELEQAHRQLANIIRSAAVGITSTDTRGLYTHWTPSCRDMLGYEEEEVVGRKTPADFAAEPYDLAAELASCLRDGRATAERAVRRKDGARRIVRETRVPMRDEDGRHVGYTAYLVDVTEQKQAQDELQRERDTLNLVVSAMGAGLALFDGQQHMQWANPTMLDWLSLGIDDFGKECRQVGICGRCDPGACPILEAMSEGLPVTRVRELTSASDAWRCLQQVFTPVVHGTTRLVALTFDITDQRRQTEQMRLINKLAERVETSLDLERVLHLVLTCVTAGHAIGFNRAFIFLLDDEGKSLEGRMAVGPLSAEDAHRIWRDLDQSDQSIEDLLDSALLSAGDTRLTEEVRTMAIPLSDAQDTLISILKTSTSAHAGDARLDPHMNDELVRRLELAEFVCAPLAVQNEPIGVMLADNKYSRIAVDREQVELLEMFSRQASLAIANARAYQKIQDQLRELQVTRDRLIEAERMASVGRMASHLAHEIRNPLTAIGGFAASIARQHKGDQKTRRNAQIICDEARRLDQTLVNVLDYTRPLRPSKTWTNLNEVVEETLQQFEEVIRDEGITVRLALNRDLPDVMADAQMMKQVVINLVKNGVESMEGKGGGMLSVATAAGDGEAEVLIGDTGGGMEQETLETLFSPFFTTKIGGVGLGMSVSRRIIEQHGGRIEVESELGVGSRFRFTVAVNSSGSAQGGEPLRPGRRGGPKGE